MLIFMFDRSGVRLGKRLGKKKKLEFVFCRLWKLLISAVIIKAEHLELAAGRDCNCVR